MNNISKKMLGEVVVFINGDRGVNYPKTKDYVPKGIPFFSASDLEGRTVNLSNAKFISNEAYERLRNGKINEYKSLNIKLKIFALKFVASSLVNGGPNTTQHEKAVRASTKRRINSFCLLENLFK